MIRGDFLLIEDTHRGEMWTPHGQPDWAVHALAAVPLFGGIGRRHLRRVIKLIVVREYGAGVRVVRVGSRGEAFHIVLDGKALVELPGGEEIVLRPGDGFGELALIDGAPRSATVIASNGLTTGRIARADFRRLIREEPAVAVGLLPGLVGIIRHLEGATTPEGGPSAGKRAPIGEAAGGATPAAAETAVQGRDLLGWMLALRHMPLFVPLSEGHLRRVAKLFAVRRYRDGSVLVREGDPGDSFCILLGGKARVERAGVKTHELESGESFGELALIDGAPRAATVTAHFDTTVARLPRSAFQKLLRDEPRIALGLVDSLVALIRELQQQ
jgi:CRP-like cAMP-binding protein